MNVELPTLNIEPRTETAPPLAPLPLVEPHPFLPWLSEAELAGLAVDPNGPEILRGLMAQRATLIRLSEDRPLEHGFEPESWKLADEALRQAEAVCAAFGGNRQSKSWWAGKRFCEAALAYPNSTMVCLAEKDEAAINSTHKWVWFYLRAYIEGLNNLRNQVVAKVTYSQAMGFASGKLVLPNRTEIYFLTYKTPATDYEGWEFGARLGKLASLSRRPDGSVIENIGWWADESLTWGWLEVLSRRSAFRKAKGLWTFTPVRGITPAIKQFRGNERVVQSAPAELLPRARLEGCPPGHMPTLTVPVFHRPSRAVYFHIGSNPFGDYTAEVRKLCEGKTEEYIERVAYGYARDSVARAFPGFTAVNILPVERLPDKGTVYQFTDPHGVRPFASIWVLASPGKTPSYYVVREFPDAPRYGDWAIPTERETSEDTRKGWDGDPGPAQNPLGWGIAEYKREWLRLERIPISTFNVERSTLNVEGGEPVQAGEVAAEVLERMVASVKYPWQRRVVRQSMQEGGTLNDGDDGSRGATSPTLRERVRERFMDSRFCNAEHAAAQGTTCLKWEFEKEQKDKSGKVVGPRMTIRPASGQNIDHGLSLVTDLLAWDRSRDYVPEINAPRLFVSEECRQTIWALSNYTGRAGESGACKEWIDLLRHLAEEAPVHVEPGKVGGGLWVGY